MNISAGDLRNIIQDEVAGGIYRVLAGILAFALIVFLMYIFVFFEPSIKNAGSYTCEDYGIKVSKCIDESYRIIELKLDQNSTLKSYPIEITIKDNYQETKVVLTTENPSETVNFRCLIGSTIEFHSIITVDNTIYKNYVSYPLSFKKDKK